MQPFPLEETIKYALCNLISALVRMTMQYASFCLVMGADEYAFEIFYTSVHRQIWICKHYPIQSNMHRETLETLESYIFPSSTHI